MSSNRRPAIWTSSRLWLIIAAIVALPLLAEFNARLTQSRELEVQQATLVKEIEAEKARHEALLKLEALIKSDPYIDYWARTFERMTKPNEVAVVAVPNAPQNTSTSSNVRAAPSRTAPNDVLSEWWTAFFGEAR